MRILKATLDDGSTVMAEFNALANVDKYATQVFMNTKPFNVWTVVSHVHPHSGEAVLMRTREMINGKRIVRIVEVDADGQPVVSVQRGAGGLWMAPTDGSGPADAVPGAKYPVHRDAATVRRYVILRAGAGNGGSNGEVRHWLDTAETTRAEPIPGMGPGDGDDDEDFGPESER